MWLMMLSLRAHVFMHIIHTYMFSSVFWTHELILSLFPEIENLNKQMISNLNQSRLSKLSGTKSSSLLFCHLSFLLMMPRLVNIQCVFGVVTFTTEIALIGKTIRKMYGFKMISSISCVTENFLT